MKKKKASNRKNQPPPLRFKFSDLFNSDYRLITLLLIVLPLLVYAQMYDFELLWDDGQESVGGHLSNAFVANPSWANLGKLFSESFFAMYVPISYLFWGILKFLAELFSLSVNSVLHLSNVAVHIANGLLVFVILKQFITNRWAVLVGVLFFLLHPIQVEAVAWVSEFRGLLAVFFSLISLYFYLKNQTKFLFLSLAFFVLAVLSKPSAVSLVLFVLVINYFHYGFKLGKNIEKTLPYALIALMTVLIAYEVQSNYDLNTAQYNIAVWQRPFAWLDSIVFYFYKIIYPYHLSASYTLSPKFISAQWWFYPAALLPLGLGYWLWLRRKSQPLIVLAAALFVAGFFTTSGFVDFGFQRYSLVTDRYLYLAMIGVALFVATMLAKTDKKYWHGLVVSVLVVFTTLSAFRQVPIWQTEDTLWSHAVNYEIVPNYAHENLSVYFNKKANALSAAGEYKQALAYFDKAIKLYPKYKIENLSTTIYNKGISFLQQKKYQQALENFDQAMSIVLDNANAHNAKVYLLVSLSQCQQAQQAVAFAQQNKVKIRANYLSSFQAQCVSQKR
ncbi:FOG: TPR repeat [uncultured Candidatus Thioglobus sp.]|nr:FOG: TPR repeat [uncultured Candidatus Thioglobus sp.]